MKKHAESHMDHGINEAQWDYIFKRFADRDAFFIETFELPEELGTVMNELYGPSAGDAPVLEADVIYAKRGDRQWNTRFVLKPKRPTRFVRVIAGPHEETCPRCQGSKVWYGLAIPPDNGPWHCSDCDDNGKLQHQCVLFTAYGVPSIDSPQSPREPGDIRKEMEALEEERREYLRAFQRGTATDEMKAREEAAHAKIIALRPKRAEADAFWSQHALAAPLSMMPCADCGAPRMGDAFYDNYPGEDPRRCTTCGTL